MPVIRNKSKLFVGVDLSTVVSDVSFHNVIISNIVFFFKMWLLFHN